VRNPPFPAKGWNTEATTGNSAATLVAEHAGVERLDMHPLDFSLDAVMVAATLGIAVYAFLQRNRFKDGMATGWHFIAPAMAIYALSWIEHAINDIFPFDPRGDIQLLLELVFALLLFYGFLQLDRFWRNKATP